MYVRVSWSCSKCCLFSVKASSKDGISHEEMRKLIERSVNLPLFTDSFHPHQSHTHNYSLHRTFLNEIANLLLNNKCIDFMNSQTGNCKFCVTNVFVYVSL